MRVITGKARGRRLVAPIGMETRPTSEMTKEAVFSIVQFEMEGAVVLDLFAGSGQMGVEALSRGASRAFFVESEKNALRAIADNLRTTGLEENARVMPVEALTYLRSCRECFDIVFMDPPYNQGLAQEALALLSDRMSPGGIILCETQRDEVLPPAAGRFARCREYRYGKAKVTTYRVKEGDQ